MPCARAQGVGLLLHPHPLSRRLFQVFLNLWHCVCTLCMQFSLCAQWAMCSQWRGHRSVCKTEKLPKHLYWVVDHSLTYQCVTPQMHVRECLWNWVYVCVQISLRQTIIFKSHVIGRGYLKVCLNQCVYLCAFVFVYTSLIAWLSMHVYLSTCI